MSAQSKDIRVGFSIDQSGMDKARRAIQDLTNDVKKLVEISNGMSGLFGGGGGAKVSSIAGQSHTSAGTQLQQKVGGATGGITDNLTKSVQATASMFRGASEGSKTALKSMTDSLRDFGRVTDREIDRIVNSLGKLNTVYGRMGRGPTLGGGSNAAETMRERLYGRDYGGGAEAAVPGAPAGAAGGGSLRSRVASLMGLSSGSGGGNGLGSMLGGLAGNAGLGFLAGGGALAIGMGAAGYMARSYRNYTLGGYEQTMDRPMWTGNIGAQLGGIFGGQAESIRGGDVARTMAMRRVSKSAEYQQLMSSSYDNALKESIRLTKPTGIFDSIAAGQFATHFAQGEGRGLNRIGNWLSSGSRAPGADVIVRDPNTGLESTHRGGAQAPITIGAEAQTGQEYALDQAMASAKTERAQKFRQMTENEMQTQIKLSNMGNEIWGGAGGMIGLSDALRTSGGFKYKKGIRMEGPQGVRYGPSIPISNTTLDAEERAQRGGWSGSQIGGAMQALAGTLGWVESGRRPGQMLSMQTGGFGSAANVAAAGGQYGGADALLKVFQSRIGRGGLDVTAGSNIGGIVSSMMMGGNFLSGGGGQGLADILLGASGGGGGFGDMLGSRRVQMGLGATDQMMSGGIDPLQKALNASAALKVAGRGAYSTQSALMNMTSGTALDIVRTGKVGGVLGKAGVTSGLVGQYLAEQDKSAFSRIDSSMLTPAQQNAVALYRKSGLTKGADLDALAGALSLGTGSSGEEALGRLQIQSERLFPTRGTGHGAGRSFSMKSQSGMAFREQGALKGLRGQAYAKARDELDEGILNSRGDAEQLDKAGIAAGANAGSSSSAAIDNVQAALLIFVQTLKREVGGGSAGAPRNSAN